MYVHIFPYFYGLLCFFSPSLDSLYSICLWLCFMRSVVAPSSVFEMIGMRSRAFKSEGHN